MNLPDFKDTYRGIINAISYAYSWEHNLLPAYESIRWYESYLTTNDLFDFSDLTGWDIDDAFGYPSTRFLGVLILLQGNVQRIVHVHFNDKDHIITIDGIDTQGLVQIDYGPHPSYYEMAKNAIQQGYQPIIKNPYND